MAALYFIVLPLSDEQRVYGSIFHVVIVTVVLYFSAKPVERFIDLDYYTVGQALSTAIYASALFLLQMHGWSLLWAAFVTLAIPLFQVGQMWREDKALQQDFPLS